MRPSSGIFNFLFVLSLAACSNPQHTTVAPAGTPAGKQTALEFASVQTAIFNPRCVGCHQQYATYAGVQRELAAIGGAVTANRMPKSGGPLSADLKKLLQDWIDAGAPEIAGQTPGPVQGMLEPTTESVYAAIFYPKCTVCHNPQGQAKFLDLSSRAVIFAARNRTFASGQKLIDFDSPDQSYLLAVIADPVEPMPPVWSKIAPVSADELKVLREWIVLGMP